MQKSKVNSSLMPATNGRTLTLHVISLPCLPNQVIPRRHTDRGKTETKSHLTVLIWNYNLSNSTIAGPDKSLLRTDQSTLQAAYKMRIKWCLLKSGHQTNQRTSLALAPASSMAPLCSRTQQHEKRRCWPQVGSKEWEMAKSPSTRCCSRESRAWAATRCSRSHALSQLHWSHCSSWTHHLCSGDVRFCATCPILCMSAAVTRLSHLKFLVFPLRPLRLMVFASTNIKFSKTGQTEGRRQIKKETALQTE